MIADLHVHSSASDGRYSPEELVELAYRQGLAVLGLTDHDTVAGIEPALKGGKKVGIQVVPGIELSTEWRDKDVHILGYYLDYRFQGLLANLKRFQVEREKRVNKIISKLRALGYQITAAEVFKVSKGEAVGRPHIAQVLISKGYFNTVDEVFTRLLERGQPAYVPRFKIEPHEAVEIVLAAGGIPVLAHPGLIGDDSLIRELKVAGLKGLEAFYPLHEISTVQHYLALARDLGLLVTGGSDYHGFIDHEHAELGSVTVGWEEVMALRARAGRKTTKEPV